MRLFVALEVPPPNVEPGADQLRAAPEHLTLRFLGEVPPEHLPALRAALEPVAQASAPFDLVLEGVGAFPSPANPRVVWVGATEGRREVSALADRIDAALRPEVPGPSREVFVPHLTLFRVRSPPQRRRALALLTGAEPPPSPRRVHVREFCLVESTLTSQGARHRTLAAYPLTGGTATAP